MSEQNIYTGDKLQVNLKQVEWDFLGHEFQSWSTLKDIIGKNIEMTGGRFKETAKEDTRWKFLVEEIVDKLDAEAKAGGGTSPFASKYIRGELAGGRAMEGFAEQMIRIMGMDPESSLAKAIKSAEDRVYRTAGPYYDNDGMPKAASTALVTTSSSAVDDASAARILAELGVDTATQSASMIDSGPPAPRGPADIDPNREPMGPAWERQAFVRKTIPPLECESVRGEESPYGLIHRLADEARRLQVQGTTAATRVVTRREEAEDHEPGL